MPNTIAQKLRIKEGYKLLALHAPYNYEQQLQPLPHDVSVITKGKDFNKVHWFILTKAQLEDELNKVLKLVKANIVCWIYYPKTTSKIKTDLTRDKGWDALLSHDELKWISSISFDETWSSFGFRLKTETDEKKAAAAKPREIFNYTNAAKKEIRLPDDLEKALEQNNKEAAFFNSLSFTNKKEYVEWILTAKREETRATRITATIERLSKGWKNPADR